MTPFDKKKVAEEMDLDETTYNELLEYFLSEAEEIMVKLNESLASNDFAEVEKCGHGIRGMAANLHIKHVQEIGIEFEVLAKEGTDKTALLEKITLLRLAIDGLKLTA